LKLSEKARRLMIVVEAVEKVSRQILGEMQEKVTS
jgi:hypothetical protein